MIKIEKVKVSWLENSGSKLLILDLSYFPKQNSEINEYLNSKEEFKNLYSDVNVFDDRKFCFYLFEKEEVLNLIIEGIKENNYSIPLMLLDSDLESTRKFCKDWTKHFNFKEVRVVNDSV